VNEDRGKVLFAQAVVVVQVVALVLEGVEGLVFNPPPGPSGPHDLVDVGGSDFQVGDPTERDDLALTVKLPVLQQVYPGF